jgi:hypothetical protein
MGRSATKSRLEIYFKVFDCMAGSMSSQNKFRKVVTVKQTCTLIFVLIFPQVVLQVAASVVVAGDVVIEYSTLGNVGREVCDSKYEWVLMAGTIYITFLSLLAVMMAWFSRDLPSAFNEKDQIFNVATISAIMTGTALGLGEVIDEPTTTPDAEVCLALSSPRLGSEVTFFGAVSSYCCLLLLLLLFQLILFALVSIGISGSLLLLIIWPKVSRVLRGEICVVSTMLGGKYSSKMTQSTVSNGPDKCSVPCFRPPYSFRDQCATQKTRSVTKG